MKLQAFVSQTLKEIIKGVQQAQKYAASAGAKINPIVTGCGTQVSEKRLYVESSELKRNVTIEQIEFDVAVTFADTAQGQAGAGVFVAGLGIGAKGKSETSNSSVSRIKFNIPIALPPQV